METITNHYTTEIPNHDTLSAKDSEWENVIKDLSKIDWDQNLQPDDPTQNTDYIINSIVSNCSKKTISLTKLPKEWLMIME